MAQKEITEFELVDIVETDDEFIVFDKSVGTTKKATSELMLAAPTTHAADSANPHAVTKDQAGLGDVTNDLQLKQVSNLSDVPDPATARTNLGVASSGEMAAHIADNANPHAVTKAQAGLGNVTNDLQCTASNNLSDVANAATSRSNIGAAADADLTAHTGDTGNPHAVDKTTIALENLSNDAQLKIASNLSDLADAVAARLNLGVKHTKDWHISGTLVVATERAGVWIAPRALVIEKAYIYCKDTGSASSTIVDINKNGTTIFTTQANRPTLDFDDGDKKAVSGTPDVTALAEGDIVSIDVDQIATDASGLSLILICH